MKLSPPFLFRRKALSLGIVVLLIWLFLYTQADLIYGPYAAEQKEAMVLYFLLFLIPAAMYMKGLPGKDEGLKSLLPFVMTMIVTIVIAIPLRWLVMMASLEYVTLFIGFGLLYAFVKAYIEEVVFRYYLPQVVGLGDIISSVLFGLFHLSVAYLTGIAAPMTAILGLMVMGYIWSMVRRMFQSQGIGAGLAASTGSHFGYNLIALGLI
jgi:membrane protease YdiL (CAAX protease family)